MSEQQETILPRKDLFQTLPDEILFRIDNKLDDVSRNRLRQTSKLLQSLEKYTDYDNDDAFIAERIAYYDSLIKDFEFRRSSIVYRAKGCKFVFHSGYSKEDKCYYVKFTSYRCLTTETVNITASVLDAYIFVLLHNKTFLVNRVPIVIVINTWQRNFTESIEIKYKTLKSYTLFDNYSFFQGYLNEYFYLRNEFPRRMYSLENIEKIARVDYNALGLEEQYYNQNIYQLFTVNHSFKTKAPYTYRFSIEGEYEGVQWNFLVHTAGNIDKVRLDVHNIEYPSFEGDTNTLCAIMATVLYGCIQEMFTHQGARWTGRFFIDCAFYKDKGTTQSLFLHNNHCLLVCESLQKFLNNPTIEQIAFILHYFFVESKRADEIASIITILQ